MPVNSDKKDRWQADSNESVNMYNEWFIRFAPIAYRKMRSKTAQQVEDTLKWTDNLTNIEPDLLLQHPEILPILRMTTTPPIARDRLIGLAGVSKNFVENMELKQRLPPKMLKSAGDFTNTNKRRKEEATKFVQLKTNYGNKIHFVLFLCGYFDTGYLEFEASEGIDWIWEHRIDDLAEFGV